MSLARFRRGSLTRAALAPTAGAAAPILANQALDFGALTRTGAGGNALTNTGGAITSASIDSGNTGTDWAISAAGIITPNQDGGLTAGPYALGCTFTNASGSDTATITITTSGNDANGRDRATAYSCIDVTEVQAACNAIGAAGGFSILLRGGNYAAMTFFQEHFVTPGVVFAPHAGATAIFDTVNLATSSALDIRQSDWIIVDGVHFNGGPGTVGGTGGAYYLVGVRDTSHDITIQNCTFYADFIDGEGDYSGVGDIPNRPVGVGNDGTAAASNVSILNCTFQYLWTGPSVRFAGLYRIEGCRVEDVLTDCLKVNWVEGITGTIIRDNYLAGVITNDSDNGGGGGAPHGDYIQTTGSSTITNWTGRTRMGWPGLVIERNIICAKYDRQFAQGIFISDMGTTPSITVASPGVVTVVAHGLSNDDPVQFSGSAGTSPPAPLVRNTTYYARNVATDTMEVALTPGGASINTTASGSGTIAINVYWYEEPRIAGNILVNGHHGGTGIKPGGIRNPEVIGNTVVNHPMAAGTCTIALENAVLGTIVLKNNVSDSIDVDGAFTLDDENNIELGAAGATISYATAFVGPSFSVTDREDLIAAWTNEPNGPLDIDNSGTGTVGDVGAGSGYVTWATTSPGNDGSLNAAYETGVEMAKINNYFNVPTVNHIIASSGARANVPLNTAYVHVTSGAVVGVRYQSRSLDPIDEFYVFMDAHGGTLGNITMQCDIYNEHASSATQPGSTLRDSSTTTTMPSADDMWIKFTFGTPYTPSAVGETLWFVVYNTAGAPTTDFPNIMTSTNSNLNPVSINHGFAYSATAGFSAAGTAVSKAPFALKQGTEYYGRAFTQSNAAFYTSNQLKRGIRFTPPVDISVIGAILVGGATTLDAVAIFADATAPGGSALHTFSLDADTNLQRAEIIGSRIWAPITLSGGTTYKAVVTFDANGASPSVNQIEDYASYSTVFDDLYDDFIMCGSCIDDGASGWTLTKAACPQLALIIEEFLP